MLKRLLNLATASILLLAVSACVSSKEPLPLKNPIQFLPISALIHHDDDGKAELYKFVYKEGTFTVFEKGKNKTPFPVTFYKTSGLPNGYHIAWMPWGKGSKYQDNYYNVAWLEKSPTGQQQVVMFLPNKEEEKTIGKELNIDPTDGPKINTIQDMVTYATTLFKLNKTLTTARFDVYDLSKKEDYARAEALAGAEFLAMKAD